MIVVPAGQGLEFTDTTVGSNSDVLLLGSSRRSWYGRQKVERDTELHDHPLVSFIHLLESCEAAMGRYEIAEKGNTRTMIPKRPTTAPAAHIHLGTCATRSSTFHTCSGTASAESMVDYWSIGS